ncbi:trans-Golgi network integral membrane protein TGN38-like [Danaus plexippus]|uniref:trans-Golgi network integral membrane protein TGN38-like n=1 Tax=Danaus plexippus TaxID=13037 RepID=UPI002AB123E8|nr:trans-Golgi network integral membrane protein TGN38-like [Danaus plexippus]
MFRYIVSLILVNTYYCSSGYPISPNSSNVLMAKPLTTVANGCKNQFLADLTRKNIEHCNAPVPAFSKTELECVMFYEISTRMCSETFPPDFNINENYTKKIQTIQDAQRLCDYTDSWKFLHLGNYTLHKLKLERVFNKKTTCIKLCSVDSVLDVDSNFYCKFFQWGTELLNTLETTSKAQQEIISEPTTQNSTQNRTVSTTLKVDNVTTSKSNDNQKNLETNLLASEKKSPDNEMSAQSPNKASESNVIETDIHKTSPQLQPSVKPESEKPLAVAEEPPKKELLEKIEPPIPQQVKDVKPNVENVKQNELDDDAENEFGNDPDLDDDPMSDQEGENGNEQIAESDPKLEVEKPKVVEKKIESITSLQQDEIQRESGMFPNPIQDSFSEEDDHFFPFFLTAIIFVVLLYILYHNKTKFTKVILGLIVEGRQTGRRRNSRGHSYRRLDTLEQAMSSNTAAPPSKIIY